MSKNQGAKRPHKLSSKKNLNGSRNFFQQIKKKSQKKFFFVIPAQLLPKCHLYLEHPTSHRGFSSVSGGPPELPEPTHPPIVYHQQTSFYLHLDISLQHLFYIFVPVTKHFCTQVRLYSSVGMYLLEDRQIAELIEMLSCQPSVLLRTTPLLIIFSSFLVSLRAARVTEAIQFTHDLHFHQA